MSETDDGPTEPIDYGLLNGAFGVLLGSLVYASRQHPERVRDALAPRELPLVFGATFAASKAVTRERIGVRVREPFVEGEGTRGRRPRGRGLRHAVGELLTCSRCAVLATSAANDFLQAGFRLLCEPANSVSSPEASGARAS